VLTDSKWHASGMQAAPMLSCAALKKGSPSVADKRQDMFHQVLQGLLWCLIEVTVSLSSFLYTCCMHRGC
jgi:hypothetical protein